MTLRIHLSPSALHCTVHESPSWFGRLVLRRAECDYEAWRIRELGGRHAWVRSDNREVRRDVAEAIERAVTKRALGARLRVLRGGR